MSSRRERFDFCWHCGALTPFRCARCKKPVCVVAGVGIPGAGCAVLRKSPKAEGVYLLVCVGRCRYRRDPAVIAMVSKLAAKGATP